MRRVSRGTTTAKWRRLVTGCYESSRLQCVAMPTDDQTGADTSAPDWKEVVPERGTTAKVSSNSTLDIVIVSYNGTTLLRSCLDSLLADPTSPKPRIIVVDNASSDGSPAMVRSRFPSVELIQMGGNLGFSRAVNAALRQSTANYVLLLNPDTIVPTGALSACVAAMQAYPHIGMLGCKLVKLDGTLDHACKRAFPTPASALFYFFGSKAALRRLIPGPTYTADHLGDDEIGFVDMVNGAFMLVRRQALEQVGLLDEAFWMYGEDVDWCYRFKQRGWPVLYWPRVVVTHVKAGITGRRRSFRINRAFHRAMWLFYRKHHASAHGSIHNIVVWTAIHLKFGFSVGRNAIATIRARSTSRDERVGLVG
jgi:GT2 family glycosyltransferase